MFPYKDSKDPHDSQSTGTCKRYQHRHDGISHTSQNTYRHVHHSAEKINLADDLHTIQTICDHFRIGRIDAKQGASATICQCTKRKSDSKYNCHTVYGNFGNPLLLTGSHILADKAQCRLVNSIHGNINKSLYVTGCRIARHGNRSERVDG